MRKVEAYPVRHDVTPDAPGAWAFEIHGWWDPLGTWVHEADIKMPADIDTELMFAEGGLLLERAVRAGRRRRPRPSPTRPSRLRDTTRPTWSGCAVSAHDPPRARRPPAARPAHVEGPFPVYADRPRALFGAWYEFFPRSEGAAEDPVDRHDRPGNLRTAAERLARGRGDGLRHRLPAADPPDRPRVNRKGRNNTLDPGPDDVGSPWAIGSAEGGHDAIHPELGHDRGLRRLRRRAAELGLEVALDLALQARPDHPWVAEHPEWFTTRADGTIAYAENPPKKYQDIYPINFDNDPEGIYAEVAADRAALDEPRRADLPGRQPAHQAGELLGVADRRGHARPTPT